LFEQWALLVAQVRTEISNHWHPPTIATCHNFAVFWPDILMGDLEAAERHSAEMVAYCAEKRVDFFGLIAAHANAVVVAIRNPTQKNMAACRGWFDVQRSIGMRLGHYMYLGGLAEGLMFAGDIEGAEALLREAFALAEETGERAFLPALHRIEGQVALRMLRPDPVRAEACFLSAIDVARAHGTLTYELAAACELARLWRETGSANSPRELLTPILAAIEGGETIPVVRDARALLAEVD
jgi:hypothetical protein